jgi:predicted Holliday junction resolvase-like endonuclease
MSTTDNEQQKWVPYNNWREAVQDLSEKGLVHNLPFIFYCVLLLLLVITLGHSNVNNIRRMVEMNKQIKEKTWVYKDEKRKLMYMTKESELNNLTQKIGIASSIEVPQKITIEKILK